MSIYLYVIGIIVLISGLLSGVYALQQHSARRRLREIAQLAARRLSNVSISQSFPSAAHMPRVLSSLTQIRFPRLIKGTCGGNDFWIGDCMVNPQQDPAAQAGIAVAGLGILAPIGVGIARNVKVATTVVTVRLNKSTGCNFTLRPQSFWKKCIARLSRVRARNYEMSLHNSSNTNNAIAASVVCDAYAQFRDRWCLDVCEHYLVAIPERPSMGHLGIALKRIDCLLEELITLFKKLDETNGISKLESGT